MPQTLTRENLKALYPCDNKYLDKFGEHESLNIEQAFDAGFTVSDICWLMGALAKRKEIIAFADFCVEQAANYAADDVADVASAADAAALAANAPIAAYHVKGAAVAAALADDAAHYTAIRKEQKKFLMEILR